MTWMYLPQIHVMETQFPKQYHQKIGLVLHGMQATTGFADVSFLSSAL